MASEMFVASELAAADIASCHGIRPKRNVLRSRRYPYVVGRHSSPLIREFRGSKQYAKAGCWTEGCCVRSNVRAHGIFIGIGNLQWWLSGINVSPP